MSEVFNPEWLQRMKAPWKIDWLKVSEADHDLIDGLIDREVLVPVEPDYEAGMRMLVSYREDIDLPIDLPKLRFTFVKRIVDAALGIEGDE